jgi:hypothetical protein
MMSSLILCLQRPPRHCTGKPAKPTNVVRPKFLGIMRNATQFPVVRTEWYCCVSWSAQHYSTLAVDKVTSRCAPSRLLCGDPLHLAGIFCVVLPNKILFLYVVFFFSVFEYLIHTK